VVWEDGGGDSASYPIDRQSLFETHTLKHCREPRIRSKQVEFWIGLQ